MSLLVLPYIIYQFCQVAHKGPGLVHVHFSQNWCYNSSVFGDSKEKQFPRDFIYYQTHKLLIIMSFDENGKHWN